MRETGVRLQCVLQRAADLWDTVLNPDNWGSGLDQKLDEIDRVNNELEIIEAEFKRRTEVWNRLMFLSKDTKPRANI